jgi:hypothetical protein
MTSEKLEDVNVPPFWPDVDLVKSDILDYYYEIEWFDSHLASMLKKIEEIVRIANTQKMVTTTGTNLEDQCISVRKCSEPNEALKSLYKTLGFKPYPFIKRKSVVHKPEIKKNKPPDLQLLKPK